MEQEELWLTADDFLRLFSVDCERAGARDFLDIVQMWSIQLLFPELEVNRRSLVRMVLRKKGISPMVYWSRMKRDLLPVLSAESDTLECLGLPLPVERTCPDLVDALARATAGHIEAEHREKYRDVATYIQRLCIESERKKGK